MKKITKISIGIPAYNEEANIKKLLISLLSQIEKGFKIIEIIVISDGSTDKTVSRINILRNKKIKLIVDKNRLGKSARIGQIFKIFKGNVIFLLDADIIINDKMLFSKVLNTANFEKSGLVGINARPYKSTSIFQKIIRTGNSLTYEMGIKWKNSNNYLLFKGCFLGLSKGFAKSISMPNEVINNDAYLYFKAKERALSPRFISDAAIYFQSPQNLTDHLKQSQRFKTSKAEMQKYFNYDLNPEYDIPASVYFQGFFKKLFLDPIFFTAYLFINILSKLKKEKEVNSSWSIAVSTKKIIHSTTCLPAGRAQDKL